MTSKPLISFLVSASLVFSSTLPAFAQNNPLSDNKTGTNCITKLVQTVKRSSTKALGIARHPVVHIKNFATENAFNLAPFALVPISAAVGGDIAAASIASAQLSGGIFMIDKALDTVLDEAQNVISPEYIVLLIAGTSNLPELGASQAAALAGSSYAESAATPLGSNLWNPILLVPAMAIAVKTRAIKEGFIKEGDNFSMRTHPIQFFKVLKNVLGTIDLKGTSKQLGISIAFLIDALFFQGFVKPQMEVGNYAPLMGWLTFNAIFVPAYFIKNNFSKKARISNAIEWIDQDSLEAVSSAFKEASSTANITIESLKTVSQPELESLNVEKKDILQIDKLFTSIKKYQIGEGSKKEGLNNIQKSISDIKKSIEENHDIAERLNAALDEAEAEDLKLLFNLSGLKVEQKQLSKREKIKSWIKLSAGLAAILIASPLIDAGVTNIAQALPGWDKSMAGFIIAALMTSLPEMMGSAKLLGKGLDEGAVKNIADSNALNLILAKMALLTAFIIGMN